MKTQFFRFLILSAAFAVFSLSAMAQTGTSLAVEIPFNFHVGNERMAAGKYSIRRVSDYSFLLQSADGNAKVLVQTPLLVDAGRELTTEKLVFNRYENKYFLREIFSSRSLGRALFESKAEKMARKGVKDNEETAKKAKAQQIAVTMKKN
jgi:hypothetical protein